jgi:hypothetical protein
MLYVTQIHVSTRRVKRQTVMWAYELALTRIFAATQHFVF